MLIEHLVDDIEDLPAPMSILDEDGCFVARNAEARAGYGGDLVGQPGVSLLTAEQKEEFPVYLAMVLQGIETHPRTWELELPDGRRQHIRSMVRVVHDEAGRQLFLFVSVPLDDDAAKLGNQLLAMTDALAANRVAIHQSQEQINFHSHQLNLMLRGLEDIQTTLGQLTLQLRLPLPERDPLEAS